MKKLYSILALVPLIFMNGCERKDLNQYVLANPPITSGIVVKKEFINSTPQRVCRAFNTVAYSNGTYAGYDVVAFTPEIYLVVIEHVQDSENGYKVHNTSCYFVTATIFGEVKVGEYFDSTGNDNIKPATLQ